METITRMSRMHLSHGEWKPEEDSPAWWRTYVRERVHLRRGPRRFQPLANTAHFRFSLVN